MYFFVDFLSFFIELAFHYRSWNEVDDDPMGKKIISLYSYITEINMMNNQVAFRFERSRLSLLIFELSNLVMFVVDNFAIELSSSMNCPCLGILDFEL